VLVLDVDEWPANTRLYKALDQSGLQIDCRPPQKKGKSKDTDEGAIDVTEGGTAIPYWLEDPFLRKEYEETLAREGVKSRMDDALYHDPARQPATV
jgi:hypothetical protein